MADARVPFREAFRFWLKLGFISFGGPAGQIAIMHREIVERRRWIGEEPFLRALNFCMLLPGPEAQQLATYVGWRLHGIAGGIVAGAFFVLPSIFVLLALSWLAVAHGDVPAVAGLLYGVQPVVVAIVAEALLRIGRRTLRHAALFAFAAAAFALLRFASAPFPLVVALAAVTGALLARRFPAVFAGTAAPPPAAAEPCPARPRASHTLRVVAVCASLWAVPVGVIAFVRGIDDIVTRVALFFTEAAFVTFGGAYAVLSYVADVCVHRHGWIDAHQMVQGLALAESTPGPLIMVVQHVAFLAGWKLHGAHDPLATATLAALVATYVTFLPSFLFIFVAAPYVEALAAVRRWRAALVAVTAAIVGVVLNLAIFFAERVVVKSGRVDPFAIAMAMAAFALVLRFRTPVHFVVVAGAITGMAWRLLSGAGAGS